MCGVRGDTGFGSKWWGGWGAGYRPLSVWLFPLHSLMIFAASRHSALLSCVQWLVLGLRSVCVCLRPGQRNGRVSNTTTQHLNWFSSPCCNLLHWMSATVEFLAQMMWDASLRLKISCWGLGHIQIMWAQ